MGCTVTHPEPPRMVHFPAPGFSNGSRAHPASTYQTGLFSHDSSSDSATSLTGGGGGGGGGGGNGVSSPPPPVNRPLRPESSGGSGGMEPRQLEPRRISAITQFCINRTRAKSITEVELVNVEDGEDVEAGNHGDTDGNEKPKEWPENFEQQNKE